MCDYTIVGVRNANTNIHNDRAGTESSTLSSINCYRWLILGLEALSH